MSELNSAAGWATPVAYEVPEGVNATDDVFDQVVSRPNHALFARKRDGVWAPVTVVEFAEQVVRLAAGLIAAGIRPGDRVALMSATRYEWVLCDFAIWSAGAVTVPVYETSSAEQVAWILRDSGAVATFTETDEHRALVALAGAVTPGRVWPMTDGGLARLAAAGEAVTSAEVHQRRAAVRATSVATIVYTSGTTGRPKGCVLTHANLVAETRNVALADGVGDRSLTERSSILLFLPLAHVLARSVQLAAIHAGAMTGHVGRIADVTAELAAFRPTIVLAVPRVFEKLYNTAEHRAALAGHSRLFRAAERVAVEHSRALQSGGPGPLLRLRRWAFDRLVYAKLRAAMGGRVEYAISGGAPLDARLGHFMRGVGITILEGYGLTETTAGHTLNLPDSQRIGSVGRPLPGCSVRVAADGELLLKGPNVFAGYWSDERATREILDEDGWLHSGDLGRLDDGYLTITGRKKDLIVTAAGKNVAPAVIEARLNAHWLIDQTVVVGDRRPFVGAFVTLDQDTFADWKREHDRPATATVADLRDDPELVAAVQAAIDDANKAVSHAEAVKRFRVLTRPFQIGAELTPTMKIKRQFVLAEYAAELDALYAAPSAALRNEKRVAP